MNIIASIQSYFPILGGFVAVATAVHGLALAVGQKWPPALKVAEVTGVVALDIQQVLQTLGVKT